MVLVVVVIDFTEKNHKFIQNKLSTSDILGYYYGFIPYIISLVTITAFIATVYVTAQLSQRTELIAILSSGKSFIYIIKSFFIGSLIIAISSFLLNGWIIPHLNKDRVAFEVMYIKGPYFFR